MDKKTKVIVTICSVFAVLFLMVYIVLGFFKPDVEEEVVYPTGKLSQSVFDSQNMSYTATQGYDAKHAFSYIPYTIDTVSGAKARIGNGSFYSSEPYYFYYSEVPRNKDTAGVIKKEMTDILSLVADESSTVVDFVKEESGYINGCAATYSVVRVAAGDEVCYMCLYRLQINKDIYDTDYDVFVGVMTKSADASTQLLGNLDTLVNTNVYTMQFSADIEKQLLRAAEESEKESSESSEESEEVKESATVDIPVSEEATENDADRESRERELFGE